MKSIKPILLILTVGSMLPATDLASADRKALLDHLNQSSSGFSNSIKGLTAEQWNFKPAPDVWSIAECAEHIALSEDLLRQTIENKILASPKTEGAGEKTPDDKVLKMITDRSFKAKAPEVLKPTGQFPTPEVAIKRFDESRQKTITLATSRKDLREHVGSHPAFKSLDAYQWLLFLSGHTVRHTDQIKEVKTQPGYPK